MGCYLSLLPHGEWVSGFILANHPEFRVSEDTEYLLTLLLVEQVLRVAAELDGLEIRLPYLIPLNVQTRACPVVGCQRLVGLQDT